MTGAEGVVEEVVDAYLKELTAEQLSFFEPWFEEELRAGRVPKEPDAVTLRTIILSWIGGWKASHMSLVQGVHDL